MATQFDTSIVDLDRTEELPVLDVEAYEASLAANDVSLPRADTWAMQSARVLPESDDESGGTVPSLPATQRAIAPESLTIHVERILKRITELEAQIVASHEINARLQKDCEALEAERTQDELRSAVLEADYARLREDRARSEEISRHLEQQLSERVESIAAIEKCRSDERDLAAHLAQQLAAKLLDFEKAGSIIELRNRTIEDLNRNCANLNQRLQQKMAAGAELTSRLSVAERSLQESHSLLLEQDDVIRQHAAELVAARAQIQSLPEEREALRSASAQLDIRVAELVQKDVELAQVRSDLAAARTEMQSQTKLLNERADELGTLQERCNAHETAIREFERANRVRGEEAEGLMTQLRASRDERAKVGLQLDQARACEKELTDQIISKDTLIAALQADLAVHAEAFATLRRDVSHIGDLAAGESVEVEHMLEPVEHEGPTLYLTREVLTVGRTIDNDISIPSKLISRCHARLLAGPTGVIIEDANSMNGVYVNGERVLQHLLKDGDVLELGNMRYRLRTRLVRDRRIQDGKLRQLASFSRKIGCSKPAWRRPAMLPH